jgi:hypothetical protein
MKRSCAREVGNTTGTPGSVEGVGPPRSGPPEIPGSWGEKSTSSCAAESDTSISFINAIKHGNNMDADKMVEVEFEQNAENFRIRVRDQGLGFDWTQTADPRADENLFLSNGRGIFFMKHFVDMVAFQHCRGKGTEVVLEKRLESAGRHGRSGGH